MVFGLWYYLIRIAHMEITHARAYIVAIMVIIQNIHAFNCRSENKSAFSVPLTSNMIFLVGIVGSIALGLLVLEFEPLSMILKTHSIPITHLFGLFLIGMIIFVVMECYKKIRYLLTKNE